MPPEWAVHPSYTRYAEAMSSTHRTRTAIQPPGMSFLEHQRALVSPIAASLASDLNALEAQGFPLRPRPGGTRDRRGCASGMASLFGRRRTPMTNSYARDSFAYGFDFTRPRSREERVARLERWRRCSTRRSFCP